MKRKILFLAIMLALSHESLTTTVTIQQADAIIQTGSATSSGNNFFSILSGSLSSDMTQTNFAGYYTPNFVSNYTQAEYQDLLNSYITDVTSANYAQAQINLIKLSAATFKNANKPLVNIPLQAANNPWTGNGKLFVPGSDQSYVQFFVDQFALVYAKLSASNNNNNNNNGSNNSNTTADIVVPLNPSQKVTDPTNAMLLEETNDDSVMDSIVNTADQALNSAVLDVEQQMNNLLIQAKSDPNIKDATTNQSYTMKLQSLVQQAETGIASNSLQSIASNYQQQIANAANTGIKNLNILAADGSNTGSLLTAYTQNLNLKSTNDQGEIATTLGQNKTSIDNLQYTIQASINELIASATAGGLPDWAQDLIIGAAEPIGTALISVISYYVYKLICSYFTIGLTCPPAVPEIVKKLGLPEDIQGLMKKLGLGKVADLINGSVSFVDQLYGKLENVLGLEPGTIKSLIGTAVTDPGQATVNFMQQVSQVQDKVLAEITDADPDDVMKAIGQVLKARPTSLSDIVDLVTRVKATLTSNPTPNTGTGTDATDDIPGATAFDNLEFDIAQTTLQQTLFNNIKELGLSVSDFQAQISDLQAKLEDSEALSAEERAAIMEQIEAGNSIINQAKDSPNDTDENPFEGEIV